MQRENRPRPAGSLPQPDFGRGVISRWLMEALVLHELKKSTVERPFFPERAELDWSQKSLAQAIRAWLPFRF